LGGDGYGLNLRIFIQRAGEKPDEKNPGCGQRNLHEEGAADYQDLMNPRRNERFTFDATKNRRECPWTKYVEGFLSGVRGIQEKG
jgi:hypothetical protein